MSTVAIIPARYGSTRLPGKPLLDRTGKPLVVHVVEQAAKAACIDRVIVATDDQRITESVASFGYEAVMTRADHENGTCRIVEACESLPRDVDVIVNVQGDEPQIDPCVIDAAVRCLRASSAPMATVVSPFAEDEDPADPNIVKAVCSQAGMALYFSRALLPFDRDRTATAMIYRKHIGLYVYRREFLSTYITLDPTPAEQAEKLEQLRVLEHGYAIAVTHAQVRHHGIDTPEQYEAFVKSCRQTAD